MSKRVLILMSMLKPRFGFPSLSAVSENGGHLNRIQAGTESIPLPDGSLHLLRHLSWILWGTAVAVTDWLLLELSNSPGKHMEKPLVLKPPSCNLLGQVIDGDPRMWPGGFQDVVHPTSAVSFLL